VRDDVVPDQVTGIEPEGRELESGDTVVVRYAIAKAGDGAARDATVVTGAAVGNGNASGVSGGDQTGSSGDDEATEPDAGGAAATTTALPAAPSASEPAPSSSPSSSSESTTSSTAPTTSSPPATDTEGAVAP
jgi:serine/threonine-protein kinase